MLRRKWSYGYIPEGHRSFSATSFLKNLDLDQFLHQFPKVTLDKIGVKKQNKTKHTHRNDLEILTDLENGLKFANWQLFILKVIKTLVRGWVTIHHLCFLSLSVCSKCESQIRGCSQNAHAPCWAGEGCAALILFRRKRRDGICEWCVSV